MATIDQRPLKAFVRFDGTGRIVPSSLILRRKKPKVGKWVEIPAYECCNPTTTAILPLRMLFSDIAEVDAVVGDSTSVTDWNSLFDLPAFGTPFTSVSVTGNEVKLYGGSNIIVKDSLFPDTLNVYLLEVDDLAGSIVEVEYNGFGYTSAGCENVTYMNLPKLLIAGEAAFNYLGYVGSAVTVNVPKLTSAGSNCFSDCETLISINAPQLTNIGTSCFNYCYELTVLNFPLCTNLGPTVGDNSVFSSITGNIITLTVPSALMTCNAGSPDGDIQYLQVNNTVTIVTV